MNNDISRDEWIERGIAYCLVRWPGWPDARIATESAYDSYYTEPGVRTPEEFMAEELEHYEEGPT